jgi:hypothetical protein
LTGEYFSNAKSALFCEHAFCALLTAPNLVRTTVRIRGYAAPILFGIWMILYRKK